VCILHNDLARAIDRGHVTALVLLNLSAAFDTVDHELLIEMLKKRFAIDGVALNWFKSYLDERTQTFMFGDVESVMYAANGVQPKRRQTETATSILNKPKRRQFKPQQIKTATSILNGFLKQVKPAKQTVEICNGNTHF